MTAPKPARKPLEFPDHGPYSFPVWRPEENRYRLALTADGKKLFDEWYANYSGRPIKAAAAVCRQAIVLARDWPDQDEITAAAEDGLYHAVCVYDPARASINTIIPWWVAAHVMRVVDCNKQRQFEMDAASLDDRRPGADGDDTGIPEPAVPVPPENRWDDPDCHRGAVRVLERMAPLARRAFVLHAAGMSQRDIARADGVTNQAIGSRIRSARRHVYEERKAAPR